MEKCSSLTQIIDSDGLTPLYTVIEQSNDSDLVWYLTLVTINEVPCDGVPNDAGDLLYSLLAVGYYSTYAIYSLTL